MSKISTTQFMDEGARNWLFAYCKRNHWRVAAWIDFDDLVQEGYFAYYDTLCRYPTATEPQHIMALFKLVMRSNIEDWYVRKKVKQIDDARSDIVETYESPAMQTPDLSALRALMVKAPQLLKDAIALLNDEKVQTELTKPLAKYDNGKRETLNDRLCKLLNKDPKKVDIVTELRTYFAT